jgi:hypothetical protein
MKPFFAALALVAFALPATSQGNNAPGGAASPAPAAPLSALAQQAYNACPSLMSRTESAAANGHTQYYYLNDCECMARAIDFNTWNESTATYDGPKMPDSDAYVIIGAFSSSATLEDAFAAVDGNVSETGYSAVSACYGK